MRDAILGKFRNIMEYLSGLNTFKFILTITLCHFLIDIIAISIFLVFDHNIPVNPQPNSSLIIIIFSWVIIGPIVETFLSQLLPIYLISRKTQNAFVIVLCSALIFSIPHCLDDVTRIIPSFPNGILLGYSFWVWAKTSYKKAYLITLIIHGIHNLGVLTIIQTINVIFG
jgi:hypothetical protein